MTYAVGGTIQASDFNGFTGGGSGSGANVSGQLNTVLGTGYGNAGYGQTLVSNVSAGATVAATNWASLINNLNMVRKHQTVGTFTNLTVPTVGANITYISTLSSEITNAYTNRLAGNYTGSSSLTKNIVISAGNNTAGSGTATFTITFPSVDQARYFWNAYGMVLMGFNTFTNTGGTTRGTSLQTLGQTNFSQKLMFANTFNARVGSGGTLVTDTTTLGWYGQPTVATQIFRVNSTSYYSGDYFYINMNSNGTAGSYGGNGTTLTITFGFFSATTNAYNSSINVTCNMLVSVNTPQSTYLTNSWGTPTIA